MFSSKSQLQKRTPDNEPDRESFLSLLVDEYLNSSAFGAKSQVLANLANFAYDPVNYGYIRNVGVLDIFLHVLKNETNYKLLRFACAGICNLCIDPLNAEYILTHGSLKHFTALLKCNYNDIVADTITILIYMFNSQTKPDIITCEVNNVMQDLKNSEDKRLVNLATIFLQDVCGTNETN